MMLVLVSKARRLVQNALAALVLVGAARFAYVGYEGFVADAAPARTEATPTERRPGADAPSAQATGGSGEPQSELITVMVSVSHGDRRSEVLLDGMPLGHTTYVGSVPCRRDTKVTIRILPKRGEPIEHVRRCDGTDIVVKEP